MGAHRRESVQGVQTGNGKLGSGDMGRRDAVWIVAIRLGGQEEGGFQLPREAFPTKVAAEEEAVHPRVPKRTLRDSNRLGRRRRVEPRLLSRFGGAHVCTRRCAVEGPRDAEQAGGGTGIFTE